MKWDRESQDRAAMEGWDIFYTTGAVGHAEYEIQALAEPPEGAVDLCNESGDPQDEVAWGIVVAKAASGSELHVKALAFLAINAYDELLGILRVLCGGEYQLYSEKPGR